MSIFRKFSQSRFHNFYHCCTVIFWVDVRQPTITANFEVIFHEIALSVRNLVIQ